MNIIRVNSVTSTNIQLKELSDVHTLEEGTALITQEQTSGRGQAGTHWESESGKNLTFSLLLYPHFLPVNKSFLLSKAVSLGLKKTLDKYVSDICIKWPNDIYYLDKKIAGILIENEIMDNQLSRSIVGIGLNINQDDFKSNAPNPVSLKQILDAELDLDLLFEEILQEIMLLYQFLQEGNTEKINADYLASLYKNTGFHSFSDKNGTFSARIENVKEEGFLCLVTNQGENRQYAFKEVSYII